MKVVPLCLLASDCSSGRLQCVEAKLGVVAKLSTDDGGECGKVLLMNSAASAPAGILTPDARLLSTAARGVKQC